MYRIQDAKGYQCDDKMTQQNHGVFLVFILVCQIKRKQNYLPWYVNLEKN